MPSMIDDRHGFYTMAKSEIKKNAVNNFYKRASHIHIDVLYRLRHAILNGIIYEFNVCK